MGVTVADADMDPVDLLISKLIDTWNADSGFHSLHGGNGSTDLRVWREFPDTKVPSPLIVIDVQSRGRVTGTTTDLYRPALQVDFFAVDPNVSGAMLKYAIDNYTIPENLPGGLVSTGFQLSLFSLVDSYGPLRYARTDTDETIRQVPSLWSGQIKPV